MKSISTVLVTRTYAHPRELCGFLLLQCRALGSRGRGKNDGLNFVTVRRLFTGVEHDERLIASAAAGADG